MLKTKKAGVKRLRKNAIEVAKTISKDPLSYFLREMDNAVCERMTEEHRSLDLLSIASHELKTPLTALKLQVEMAKKALDRDLSSLAPEKIRSIINRTYQDTLRLTRLVDDMLDISRMHTGKFHLQCEFFHLGDFLEDLLERASTGINKKDIIEMKINAPVIVHWDKYRIEQVLLNLLTNAIRYGEDSKIEITAHSGGGYAYVRVKDHGPGIPFDQQKTIFERYKRGVSCRQSDGLGLGLYISNEIVKHHQGNINLESTPGLGASFEVQIPLHPVGA